MIESRAPSSVAAIEKLFLRLMLVPLIFLPILFLFAPQDWWQTADQRGQRSYDSGNFEVAAKQFSSMLRRGAALYRAGLFESAANEFARVNSPEGHFNRGNALVMNGQYLDAISAYERALEMTPHWIEAEQNLNIARLRAEKTKLEGGNMTGGMLGADEVVFSTDKTDSQDGMQEQVEGGETLSDKEIQSLWLLRVQTKPADFLRNKFAFQLSSRTVGGDEK